MNYTLAAAALLAPNCSGANKIALQGFALFANEDCLCSATLATIAKAVGLNRSTMCRSIEPLKAVGYLVESEMGYLVTVPDINIVAPRNKPESKDVATCNNLPEDVATRNKSPNTNVATRNNLPEDVATRNKSSVATCNSVATRNKDAEENATPPQDSPSPPTPPSIYIPPSIEYPSTQKINNIQATNIKSTNTVNCKGNALADVIVTLKEIWGDAKETLARKGLSSADADKALKAALPGFTEKANSLKAKGFPGISNKRAYLAHMLAGMALEPTPAKQQAEEPKTLDDILAHLKAEYGKAYPDYTARINDLIDNLPPNLFETMRDSESLGWPSIASPLAWVKSRVEPLVVRGIAMAKDSDRENLKTQIADLKIKLLARKQCLAEDIAAEKPASVIDQTKQAIERLVSKISELEQAREVA